MQRISLLECRVRSSWLLATAFIVVLSVDNAAPAASFRFPDDEPVKNQAEHHNAKLPERPNSIRFPDADKHVDEPLVPQLTCGISKFYRQRRPRQGIFDLDEESIDDEPEAADRTSRMLDFDREYAQQRPKGRVINGKESKPGAWPWQVSLQLLHPKWGFIGHWCGGILIDSYWVLTAAHCISNDVFSYPYGPMWTVVVGEHDRSVEEGNEQRLMVEKVILHERFKEYHNDIALMRLRKPAALNVSDHVGSICLPSDEDMDVFQGVKCIATGWGQSKYGSKLDQVLHQAELPVVDNKHCKQMYGTMYNIPINKYHLCAGPLHDGGVGTCIGDSGGPLQCSLRDGRWYLAGITSFGSGCAKPGFPDVFTRITYYLPWIRGKVRSFQSTPAPT